MKSRVKLIPLYEEFAELFFLNSVLLRFKGVPFLRTSIEFLPEISMTALECDKSVVAKSYSLTVLAILSFTFLSKDTTIQISGPVHKIRVSLL